MRLPGHFELVGTANDGEQYIRSEPFGLIRGYPVGSNFRIAYVSVKTRYQGQGYGKELVASATSLAQGLGLTAVTATVVSPEMYGVLQSLYGPAALTPPTWDEFHALGGRAEFSYQLPQVPGAPSSAGEDTGAE